MKICISKKNKNVLIAIVLIVGLWYLLSLFNNENVVPKPISIFKYLCKIFTDVEMLKNIGITFTRLSIAMAISIIGGILIGIIVSSIKVLKDVVREMLSIIQVIPPVSVLIMAIMWFGLTGIPAIFIVTFSLIPIISISVIDAVDDIDDKILEMAKVFSISKFDVIYKIYIPAIKSRLWTAIGVGLTMGSKIIVMGELLTTSSGIGGKIATARLNIEPEGVIAWTVVVIMLYYILDYFVGLIREWDAYE